MRLLHSGFLLFSSAVPQVAAADFCCFDPANVHIRTVGPEFIITIDEALCPPVFEDMHTMVKASNDKGLWSSIGGEGGGGLPANAVFPCTGHKGEFIPQKLWNKHTDGKTRAALCGGGMAGCGLKAVEAVLEQGRSGSATKKLTQAKEFLLKQSQNKKQKNVILVNTHSKDQANHPIHFDSGQMNINFHLNAGFEDSGTSFWRSRQENCSYVTQTDGLTVPAKENQDKRRKGKGRKRDQAPCSKVLEKLPDGQGDHRKWAEVAKEKGSSEIRGALLDKEDPMGLFDMDYLVGYKQNRMALYSGHLFHAAQMGDDAVTKVSTDPTKGRLVLHQFMNVPKFGEDLKALGLNYAVEGEDSEEL